MFHELNELNTVRYLFIGIGFQPGGSGPYTCTQIYIRKNTDHRTRKIKSKTNKTVKFKENNNNVN